MKGRLLFITGMLGFLTSGAALDQTSWVKALMVVVIGILVASLGYRIMEAAQYRKKKAMEQATEIDRARDHTFHTWVKYTRIM